jgi:hypothetical protein
VCRLIFSRHQVIPDGGEPASGAPRRSIRHDEPAGPHRADAVLWVGFAGLKGRLSLGDLRLSLGDRQLSLADCRLTPGHRRLTPGDRQLTPGRRRLTPGHCRLTPGDCRLTPGDRQLTLGQRHSGRGQIQSWTGQVEYQAGRGSLPIGRASLPIVCVGLPGLVSPRVIPQLPRSGSTIPSWLSLSTTMRSQEGISCVRGSPTCDAASSRFRLSWCSPASGFRLDNIGFRVVLSPFPL